MINGLFYILKIKYNIKKIPISSWIFFFTLLKEHWFLKDDTVGCYLFSWFLLCSFLSHIVHSIMESSKLNSSTGLWKSQFLGFYEKCRIKFLLSLYFHLEALSHAYVCMRKDYIAAWKLSLRKYFKIRLGTIINCFFSYQELNYPQSKGSQAVS